MVAEMKNALGLPKKVSKKRPAAAEKPAAAGTESDSEVESSPKAPKQKKLAASTKAAAPTSGEWKFPGIPKAKVAPRAFKNFKVYTSLSAGSWRALKAGEKVDKSFQWGTDKKQAQESWCMMLKHVGYK